MENDTTFGLFLFMIGFGLEILIILGRGLRETCLISILGLVVLVAGIIGFIYMHKDRHAFGGKHAKSIELSLKFYIVYVILQVVLILAVFAIATNFARLTIAGDEKSAALEFFENMKKIVFIGILGTMFAAIARYFLVKELETVIGKKILISAVITFILFSVISSIITVYYCDRIILYISSQGSFTFEDFQNIFNVLSANTYLPSLIMIVPNVLFLIAFYIPYESTKQTEHKEEEYIYSG